MLNYLHQIKYTMSSIDHCWQLVLQCLIVQILCLHHLS